MSQLAFECSRCGSHLVRFARSRNGKDSWLALFGYRALRCEHCGARWRTNLLLVAKFAYAKCPRCLEMDLTSWDLKHYHVPKWRRLLLALGAHRYRCSSCRYNFISFRRKLNS